jgi:hypothetical protein
MREMEEIYIEGEDPLSFFSSIFLFYLSTFQLLSLAENENDKGKESNMSTTASSYF